MSAMTEETTYALETLDFEPTCDCNTRHGRCAEEASHRLVCSVCGEGAGLSCIEHAIYVRRQGRSVTHKPCGASAPMSELVEVVPLWGS